MLWNMRYQQNWPGSSKDVTVAADGVVTMPPLPQDLVLEDTALENVKAAWKKIVDENEETFMQFDAREGMEDDDTI